MTMDSTRLGLHGLPPETLQQIASCLKELHRPSLNAFALVSKTCHRATIPSIFHHIHLTISSGAALERDINALIKTLSHSDSARHVRCLSIKGSLQCSTGPKVEGYQSGTPDRHTWFKVLGMDEILGDEEEPYCMSPHVVYDEPVIAKSSEEDLAWAPVVSLVKILPCLAKLVYDCRNQFPPSLLDTLHEYRAQCKLYHLTFKLRTLLWGTPYPYEMAMATSPCLYSVKVECSKRDSEGDDDFNQEAMMQLVAGLAPNLKEVSTVNLIPEASMRYFRRQREQWQGLPGFVSGKSIGSLASLSLVGAVDLQSPSLLQAWAKHTDFNCLQHLSLGGGYGCETIGVNGETMEWIAYSCSFAQLKTLRIRLTRNDLEIERPNYTSNAVTLFRAFKPLEELSVSGPLEPEILGAILDQHGQTLKKLILRPSEQEWILDNDHSRHVPMVFTKEHILQIQAQCPLLQELAVPVKRTKSDAREADVYKSFGKMKQLRSLFLALDCSDWLVTRDPSSRDTSSFDDADHEPCKVHDFVKKGHLRETFMNCAVDEALARSIWETIDNNKVGQRLETLKLWTTGGGKWGNGVSNDGVLSVATNIGRSWLIDRVARDDEDIINARELGKQVRESHDQQSRLLEDSEIIQVFRRVWPQRKGRSWREDWSSLPLQA